MGQWGDGSSRHTELAAREAAWARAGEYAVNVLCFSFLFSEVCCPPPLSLTHLPWSHDRTQRKGTERETETDTERALPGENAVNDGVLCFFFVFVARSLFASLLLDRAGCSTQ